MATVSSLPPANRLPPLAAFLSALLRHRWLLIGLPVLGVIVGAATVTYTRKYTADGFFTPQSSSKNSGASSLGAQLGIPGSVVGPESVEFYRTLINSRDLLAAAAQSTYHFAKQRGGSDSLSGTLLNLYHIKTATPLDGVTQGAAVLRGSIGIGMDRQAMVIDIRVTTPWPELSEQVAARMLELLSAFNVEKRHSRYVAERRLIEDHLDSAGREVLTAEDGQKRFLERNRQWRDDPRLSAEMQKATRKVEDARQVYQGLRQMYQETQMEDVRDIPILTILQSPIGTARAAPPLSQGTGLGFLIGALLALSVVLLQEYAARERELNPAAYEEIERLAGRLRGKK